VRGTGPGPAATDEIRLIINGEARAVRADSTVADVLHILALDPRTVVVEHNREILRDRDQLMARRVAAGDELEIVHFVGGG
jgi:thiamine biosynthesis protein ThiS